MRLILSAIGLDQGYYATRINTTKLLFKSRLLEIAPLENHMTYLIYKNATDWAKKLMIIPTAAKVPPSNVTVLYEYLIDKILETGPAKNDRNWSMSMENQY